MPGSAEEKYRSRSANDPWDGLPESWRLMPLGRVARISASNVDKKTDPDEVPVRLCNYTDVYYNEFINDDLDFMKASATLREIDAFRLRGGEVLLTKDSETAEDIAKPAFVRPGLDGVVCGYHLYVLRPRPEVMDGRFLMRACSVPPVSDQFVIGANGITRFGLGQQELASALIPVPPLPKQRTIAEFLDRETARIDDLIAQKERLLELLDEQRMAMITQAVTKGLDPDVEMKDSGVEWIGEIPSSWKVLPLRRLSLRIQSGVTPPTRNSAYYDQGSIPWYSPADFPEEGARLRKATRLLNKSAVIDRAARVFPAGSIFLVAIGATLGRVAFTDRRASSNQQLVGIVPSDLVRARFLALQLSLAERFLRNTAPGSTLPIIDQETVGDLPIAFPSIQQQDDILDATDRIKAPAHLVKKNVVRGIDLLSQYRTALISAAVTGKIDVREET